MTAAVLVWVIFSAPTTNTSSALPERIALTPAWIAAEPDAQAFSQRVAGLKRSPGSACNSNEAANPSGTSPELK